MNITTFIPMHSKVRWETDWIALSAIHLWWCVVIDFMMMVMNVTTQCTSSSVHWLHCECLSRSVYYHWMMEVCCEWVMISLQSKASQTEDVGDMFNWDDEGTCWMNLWTLNNETDEWWDMCLVRWSVWCVVDLIGIEFDLDHFMWCQCVDVIVIHHCCDGDSILFWWHCFVIHHCHHHFVDVLLDGLLLLLFLGSVLYCDGVITMMMWYDGMSSVITSQIEWLFDCNEVEKHFCLIIAMMIGWLEVTRSQVIKSHCFTSSLSFADLPWLLLKRVMRGLV